MGLSIDSVSMNYEKLNGNVKIKQKNKSLNHPVVWAVSQSTKERETKKKESREVKQKWYKT